MRYRRSTGRPALDPGAVRFFVYRLHDASGDILYIGRSGDVAGRIRGHKSDADHPYMYHHKAEWFYRTRSVSMIGPFAWDEAVKIERREIEAHMPPGNRQFVTVRRGA